jgi:hypothetical protein
MSQPVAIDFTTYITLVEGKVIKGPIAPKMEVMEKWIVSGGRDISIDRDHESGHYRRDPHCRERASTADRLRGRGRDDGARVTEAIVDYLKAQPKPDPEGKDLPLFKGNGGVASVAEIELEREARDGDEDEAPDEDGPKASKTRLDDALNRPIVADADRRHVRR